MCDLYHHWVLSLTVYFLVCSFRNCASQRWRSSPPAAIDWRTDAMLSLCAKISQLNRPTPISIRNTSIIWQIVIYAPWLVAKRTVIIWLGLHDAVPGRGCDDRFETSSRRVTIDICYMMVDYWVVIFCWEKNRWHCSIYIYIYFFDVVKRKIGFIKYVSGNLFL